MLLGAAARTGALDVTEDDLWQAVVERVPERFHNLNRHALAFAG